MKFETATLVEKIKPTIAILKRYQVLLFLVAFLSIYVYLVQHIGALIQSEPNQATTQSSVKPISRLKIDQKSVTNLKELESQNIAIQSLFEDVRRSPFTED